MGDAFVSVPTGQPPAGTAATALAERLSAVCAEDQRAILLELVLTHVAEVLGREVTAPQRPLEELGFDSLTALELADRLAADTGLTLSGTLAFDYPSADALAGHLWSELVGRPQRQLRVNAALTHLDAVDAALTGLTLDASSAARLTDRLRQLIDACDRARGAEITHHAGSEDLATASADELLDIIRNEFGGGELPIAGGNREARDDVERG